MDLVVRSPHGTADVTVETARVTSVGDVVAEVTGQAVPPIVVVDDRVVPASTPLSDENVRVGSVLSTVTAPDEQPAAPTTGVQLVQHAGRGAGSIRTIGPGQYRIGPGRRMTAAELADAPVEQTAFELVVAADSVTVHPVDGFPASLAGHPISEPTAWVEGDLLVGHRVFGAERPLPAPVLRPSDPDGRAAFARSAALTRGADARTVVDAVQLARRHDPALWRRRLDAHGSLTLPIGLVDEGGPLMRRVSVMLGPDRGVALVGSDECGEALARALLVEVVTTYGPADVSIVIATSADRAGRWDWAKWLPHARDRGQLTILATEAAQRRWADARWRAGDAPSTVAVLVVDEPAHWNRRNSPLRDVVSMPPPAVRLVVQCATAETVPASCRSLVVQDGDQVSVTSATNVSGVRELTQVVPSLVEASVAAEVARALAPLVDIAADPTSGDDRGPSPEAPVLADALRAVVGRDAADRQVRIGATADGDLVEIDWQLTSEVAIVAADRGDADAMLVALTAGLIAGSDAGAGPLLLVDDGLPSAVLDLLGDLPHVGGRVGPATPLERRRILDRLADHLDRPGSTVGVVLVGAANDAGLDGWVADVRAMAGRRPALRLVSARHGLGVASGEQLTVGSVGITVDRRDGTPLATMTGAQSVRSAATDGSVTFAPLASSPAVPGTLAVRPFVVGRPFTSLERRVARNVAARQGLDEPTRAAVAATLAGLSRGTAPPLVPPPLPGEVDVDLLFAAYEADAIPLGVADDTAGGIHPVVWWQPGRTGSIVFVGSPRAGLDRAVSTILRGISERVSPSDLRLVAVDSSVRRLATAAAMPHTVSAIPAERTDQVAAAIEHLAAELGSRRRDPDAERPELVFLVHDLGHVVRRLGSSSHRGALESLDEVARSTGHGISIVAVTSTISGLSGLVDAAADVYVGLMTNEDERLALGFDELAMTACSPGRCWSRATGRLVQLAAPAGRS